MTSRTADAVRSEWTKMRTLQSTVWTVLVTIALGIGFGALLSLAGARKYATLAPADQAHFDPAATSLAGHVMAQLAIAVLGVLVITSEFATGMIGTSLTIVPRRGRLLAAKTVVLTAVALVVGEVIGFGAFFVGQAVLAGQGAPHTTLGEPHVLRAVVGAGLYLAAVGLLGVAVGTLVRATAGALAIMVGATLLVPVFTPALPDSWARVVGRFWPTMAGERVMTSRPDGHFPGPWAGFVLLCAAVAVVLAVALRVFRTRDA
ncbi:ABC transporter permease [Actinomadura sp. DC4]|uniref:ABC transporter permease n=1 Tax=Actinomadura sp. DC4 TaxID=3055069 RepID=UPI0025B22E0D|nr:ABC transporter permease [Actinomadura sp. DC4]MDN3359575.1 ABC transporter permease [Actinomadura sp. DC4]